MIIKNVLVIGAGLSGSSTSNLIKNHLHGINFKVFDKGNRPGGRLTTTISRQGGCQWLDLGFKYISSTDAEKTKNEKNTSNEEEKGIDELSRRSRNNYTRSSPSISSYSNLITNDLIQATNSTEIIGDDMSFDPTCSFSYSEKTTTSNHSQPKIKISKYVSRYGFQSLVEYFLKDISVETNCKVVSISKKMHENKNKNENNADSNQNNSNTVYWEVKTDNGLVNRFDCIISTIPIPQLLELDGNFKEFLQEDQRFKELEKVKYSSNWTLGLFCDTKKSSNFFQSLEWSGKHLSHKEDNILDWIYVDSHAQSIVVHAKDTWTLVNIEKSREEVKEKLLQRLYLHLPKLDESDVKEVMVKKWMYSQPISKSRKRFNTDALIFQKGDSLPFIVGGDGICGSGYENCINSGITSFQYLKQAVTSSAVDS